jgi:para-aminobenzoate synthetase component 1
MNQQDKCFEQMNKLGKAKVPFLFVLDFELKKPLVIPLNELDSNKIRFHINGFNSNNNPAERLIKNPYFKPAEADQTHYYKAFEQVMFHLRRGDTYLLNLTMPVSVDTNLSLFQIFDLSSAKYKLWIADECVVFSPETFVTIQNGIISTFPMKGTIRADRSNAAQILLDDAKEKAEHYTIVDLLRNDLNSVAEKIRVDHFRYLQKVETNRGALWQTSSHISGVLPQDYLENLGTIFQKLLPAGSITGAPKKRTTEIILQAENYSRGYYTGVMGVFDGQKIDSGVMIRFVEQTKNGLVYKAGGGITVNSKVETEYNELLEKVYLPIKSQINSE